jgi:LuxR family transcriptional regulator, maltose regulon positive regulatory protein
MVIMKHVGLSDLVLLSTKLKMPAPRREYIIRSELFSVLSRCPLMKIIYVKGAAGMGKTTLISSFIKETGPYNTAWLTLDETNNNVFSFWHYFAAAAENFLGDEFENILTLLRSNFETSQIQNLLTMMINHLCSDKDYYMVLDDMHCITDETLVGSIEYFIKSMPENLHIFMISREDPKLYLGELAVSGKLLFIDGDMLRFTCDEGMRFLKDTLKLKVNDEELLLMNDFAEGWIGGLQLVAAAGGAKKGLLQAAGSGIAADYLTREIFKMLTEDERLFLTVTGVLSYFDEDICLHIIGDMDFKSMIERLTTKNLFIICIDEENGIYRYHNILGEYLKQQFSCLPKQDQIHYRKNAAKILEAHGDKEEALYHLFKVEDYSEVMRLLITMDESVETWTLIDKLPLSYLLTDVNLSLQCLMYNFGRINITRVSEIYKALEERDEFEGFKSGLQYVCELIVNNSQTFITPLPVSFSDIENYSLSPVTKSLILFENANILLEQKDYEGARLSTDKALEAGGKSNVFVYFYSLSTKAQILEETGRLNESLNIYRQMNDFITSSSIMDALGYNYFIGITGVYHKRMDEENSKKALETVDKILKRCKMPTAMIELGYEYHLAEKEFLFGDPKKGVEIVAKIAHGYFSKNYKQLDRLLYGLLSQNLLPEDLCNSFIEEIALVGIKNSSLTSQLFYARVMWKNGSEEEAKAIVESILSFSRENKNYLRLIEADLLKIRMLAGDNKDQKRVIGNLLKEAVYYAWENRIIQPFFLEKDVLCPFLEQLLKSDTENLNRGERQFVFDVIKICSGKNQLNSKELLSARELEVLSELSKGLTNPEIASNLCISLATVKTHIMNIYGKLGVSSRIAAIDEAKKNGII